MSEPLLLVVFAYDTPSDRRRQRLAKTLADWAQRVQRSVFEGYLTQRQLALALTRLSGIVHSDVDQLRVYQLCSDCRTRLTVLGAVPKISPPPEIWIA